MDHQTTQDLATLLRNCTRHEISEPYPVGRLDGFHQWVDGKVCEGAFLVQRDDLTRFWLLFIDWKGDDNYYIVVFPENRLGPVCELHRIQEHEQGRVLEWTYSPRKQDEQNEQRKAYFIATYGTDSVSLTLPETSSQADDFVDDLIELTEYRLKADVLDENIPPLRDLGTEVFPEGRRLYRLHSVRERNPKLIREAKRLAMARDGALRCACCKFDFGATYGDVGHGYIEAHHTKPLSSLDDGGGISRVEDLALVCANCHRMLHLRRPWLEVKDLAEIVTK